MSLRRKFVTFLTVALLTLTTLIIFELSGDRRFPGGAHPVNVISPIDSSYKSESWRTLTVGYHSRTVLSDQASHLLTSVGVNNLQGQFSPLFEKLGLVEARDIKDGAEGIRLSQEAAAEWSGQQSTTLTNEGMPVGGSSALIRGLAFLDSQTVGDLTNGRVIAGTGGLDDSFGYDVNSVVGVKQKLKAAEWVDADIVLVPYQRDTKMDGVLANKYNMWDADDVIALSEEEKMLQIEKAGPWVIRVDTFAEAIDLLVSLGGACSCQKPEMALTRKISPNVMAPRASLSSAPGLASLR